MRSNKAIAIKKSIFFEISFMINLCMGFLKTIIAQVKIKRSKRDNKVFYLMCKEHLYYHISPCFILASNEDDMCNVNMYVSKRGIEIITNERWLFIYHNSF